MITIGFVDKAGERVLAQSVWPQVPRRGDIVILKDIDGPQVVVWVSWVEEKEGAPPTVRCGLENQMNRGAHAGKKK